MGIQNNLILSGFPGDALMMALPIPALGKYGIWLAMMCKRL